MKPTTSAARIAANQANAQLSTGPTTVAGKLASRRNALKHGLTSKIVDLEALELEVPTGVDADGKIDPIWLHAQMLLTMMQLQRAGQIELIFRDEAALRAATMWDEDRTLEAALIGEKLPKQPGATVARLQLTPHGCLWLIERWQWLARAAATPDGWNEALTKLAFGLLGINAEGQIGTVLEAVAGRRAWKTTPPMTLLALAEAMIANLEALHEVVAEHDAMKREMAIDDATDLPSPDLARLRRYVAALQKRMQWLLQEQREHRPIATQPQTPPASASIPTSPTRPHRTNPMRGETNPMALSPDIAASLPELASLLTIPPKRTETNPNDLFAMFEPHVRP